MKELVADKELVAHCGLYCGACGAYLKGRCGGCHENEKATWCKIRSCCMENKYSTCGDCGDFSDVKKCGKFHNLISRIIGFVLRSDRPRCIARVKEAGLEAYSKEMAEAKRQSMPRT